MNIQTKLILIWITFAILSGVAEAFFFNKKKKHVTLLGKNIHIWFTILRALVAIPLCIYVFNTVGILESILLAVIFMLSFPFFHDGMYYTTRELLKKGTYPRYFIDQSYKTDAIFSFNFVIRTTMLIIALLIFPY